MKITIPAERFHITKTLTCPIGGIPEEKHNTKDGKLLTEDELNGDDLEGGALSLQNPLHAGSDKKVYLVINSVGQPVRDQKEYKTYAAEKPFQAAIKAYYGLLRSQKPVPSQQPSEADFTRVADIVSHNLSPEDAALYMSKVRRARLEIPALINIRRIDDSRIKTYVCYYNLIDNPNRHELNKGIVKVAKAEELSKYKKRHPTLSGDILRY